MGQVWINVATNQRPGIDGVWVDSISEGGYDEVMSVLDELSAEVKAETYRDGARSDQFG